MFKYKLIQVDRTRGAIVIIVANDIIIITIITIIFKFKYKLIQVDRTRGASEVFSETRTSPAP